MQDNVFRSRHRWDTFNICLRRIHQMQHAPGATLNDSVPVIAVKWLAFPDFPVVVSGLGVPALVPQAFPAGLLW